MGIAIAVPQEFLDVNREIQKRLWQSKITGDYSILFTSEFIQRVNLMYSIQEAFIREQFIKNNNYFLDPYPYLNNKPSGLRFTGQYLLWFLHSSVLLINSKIDTLNLINSRRKLVLNLEPYLRSQGQLDGVCLSLLVLVPKSLITNRNNTEVGWTKYQDIASYMNNIDTNTLQWMAGTWDQVTGRIEKVPKTPENVKAASSFYWKAHINYILLQFNEAYLSENFTNTMNAIDEWATILLQGELDPNIVTIYASYIQKALPVGIAMFERLISAIWVSTTIDPLYKIELIIKIFAAYDTTFCVNNGSYSQSNIAKYNVEKGADIVLKVKGWIPELFIQQFSIENNYSNIGVMIERLKNINAFSLLKNELLTIFNQLELISTVIGEEFPVFYNNIMNLKNDDLTVMFADYLASDGLTQIANELMTTITDSTLKKEYPVGNSNIAFILTTEIQTGNPKVINVVYNLKNGRTTIDLDSPDGSIETISVEIINYFAKIPVDLIGPVVVKTAYDTVLVIIN